MKRVKAAICVFGLTLSLSSSTLAGNIGLPRASAAGNIGLPRASAYGNIGLPRASATGNIGLPRTSRSSEATFDLNVALSGNFRFLFQLFIDGGMLF